MMTLGKTANDSSAPASVPLGLASGVAWQATARWSAQVLSWAVTLAVARFLSPDAYGVMGMAVIVVSFTGLLTDFGIGTTVVTQASMPSRLASQLHGLSASLGVAMTLAVCLLAKPIAAAFGEPRVAGVLWVLSATFFCAGMSTVPLALLRRRLAYRLVSQLEFLRAIVTSAAVLSLALYGAEYWALAIGNLIGAVVFAIALMFQREVSPSIPRAKELGSSLHTSRDFLVGTLSWFGYSNADSLILGRLAGAATLGQYRFSVGLASLPGEKLVNVLTSVTLPVFSAIKHDRDRLRALLLDLTEIIAVITMPSLAMLGYLAPTAVPMLFGAQWIPAVQTVQLLCIAAFIKNLGIVLSQVLSARGRARATRRIGLVALSIMPVMFWVGARSQGAYGVAIAWIVAQPLLLCAPLFLLWEELKLSTWAYLFRLVPAVLTTAAMLLSATLSERVAPGVGLSRVGFVAGVASLTFVLVLALPYRVRVTALLKSLKA
jgi:teichuronic acid exporter